MFEYTVDNVFRLRGRGTVAVGGHPRGGSFRSGDVIDVVRDEQVVLTARAHYELHVRPGTVALLVDDEAADIRVGDLIRRRE